jgi:hypothetical protein
MLQLICGVIMNMAKRVGETNSVDALHRDLNALKEKRSFTWVFNDKLISMDHLINKFLAVGIDGAHCSVLKVSRKKTRWDSILCTALQLQLHTSSLWMTQLHKKLQLYRIGDRHISNDVATLLPRFKVKPSRRFPSDLARPCGSLIDAVAYAGGGVQGSNPPPPLKKSPLVDSDM